MRLTVELPPAAERLWRLAARLPIPLLAHGVQDAWQIGWSTGYQEGHRDGYEKARREMGL